MEKYTTIFSKNHIVIQYHTGATLYSNGIRENLLPTQTKGKTIQTVYSFYTIKRVGRVYQVGTNTGNSCNSWRKLNSKRYKESQPKYQEVRVKSPLGFYYSKKVIVNQKTEEKRDPFAVTKMEGTEYMLWKIWVDPTSYWTLQYPIRHCNNMVGTETRPWELIDTNGMDDKWVNVLFSEVEKLINICRDNKIQRLSESYNYHENTTTYTLVGGLEYDRQKMYKELFGNEKGPRYMTNEEKILAHGFDLKESFRKPKESK